MAVLRPEVQFKFAGIKNLIVQFPYLNGSFLALVGKRARFMLRNNYLSGQDIFLKRAIRDRKGRYLVSSDVAKNNKSVKIYSYPINLFERGRGLRSGVREAGTYTITRKLKQDVMARTATYTRDFEDRILKQELKKVGL